MPTFPEYRNTRRQTDRKESRKEQLKDDTKRHNTTQPGGGGVALPISVTLDSWFFSRRYSWKTWSLFSWPNTHHNTYLPPKLTKNTEDKNLEPSKNVEFERRSTRVVAHDRASDWSNTRDIGRHHCHSRSVFVSFFKVSKNLFQPSPTRDRCQATCRSWSRVKLKRSDSTQND